MAAAELSLSQTELVAKYQKILDKNGIHELVEKVVVTQPNMQGEQFASVCLYIKLHLESGGKQELFIKQQPTNEMHRKFLEDVPLFEKEAGFFNTLLPDMQKYAKDHGFDREMDFFPRCMHADENETVLENLVLQKGYYMVPKAVRQNLEQVEMALNNLAHFHAVGYCMISDAGGPEPYLEKYPFAFEALYYEGNPLLLSMFESGLGTACDLLANNKVSGGEAALGGLSKFRGTLTALICRLAARDHLLHVVNHGDCWNNNMLFVDRPKQPGKVKHQVLIDMQVIRVTSPMIDLCYYLCTSMPTALRRKNWTRLVRLYYDALKAAVERLSPAAGFPYTVDQFLAEARAKFPLGFFVNLSITVAADVMGSIEFSNLPNPKDADPNEFFRKTLTEWVAANPKKAAEYTKEIVELWGEYEEVTQT